MQIQKVVQDNFVICQIRGRLDGLTAPDLEEAFESELDTEVYGYILDLEALEYISSAGLRAILFCSRQTEAANLSFHICGLSDTIKTVFTIAGFPQLMDVNLSLADVIASRGR